MGLVEKSALDKGWERGKVTGRVINLRFPFLYQAPPPSPLATVFDSRCLTEGDSGLVLLKV